MTEKSARIKAFADEVISQIKQVVKDALAKADGRIEALEKRITELEAKQ